MPWGFLNLNSLLSGGEKKKRIWMSHEECMTKRQCDELEWEQDASTQHLELTIAIIPPFKTIKHLFGFA